MRGLLMDYDMFGYGIEEGNFVAVPTGGGRSRPGMRIYQYKDGRYLPRWENALKWIPESLRHEPFPLDISDRSPAPKTLKLDRAINLSRFSLDAEGNPW
jgi:hypothetical protein